MHYNSLQSKWSFKLKHSIYRTAITVKENVQCAFYSKFNHTLKGFLLLRKCSEQRTVFLAGLHSKPSGSCLFTAFTHFLRRSGSVGKRWNDKFLFIMLWLEHPTAQQLFGMTLAWSLGTSSSQTPYQMAIVFTRKRALHYGYSRRIATRQTRILLSSFWANPLCGNL